MNSLYFSDYLKLQPDEHIDHLPHVLFRKYIAYAQRYIKPELSKQAKDILNEFYLKLRKQYQNDNCTPVTIRQMHSLIRLTQVESFFFFSVRYLFSFRFSLGSCENRATRRSNRTGCTRCSRDNEVLFNRHLF